MVENYCWSGAEWSGLSSVYDDAGPGATQSRGPVTHHPASWEIPQVEQEHRRNTGETQEEHRRNTGGIYIIGPITSKHR